MYKNQTLVLGILFLFSSIAWTSSYNTVKIKSNNAASLIDIEYPQGFTNKQVDLRVKNLIDTLKKPYSEIATTNHFTRSHWDQDSLQVHFKVESNNPKVVSLLFDIQTYEGAEDSSSEQIKTLNFINGNEVKLEQLFKPNSDYLSKIASYCYKNLLKKEISDKQWLKNSSKPIRENYKKWYFNKKGMVIVFNATQVSKSLSIPISVTIPYTTLKSWPFTEKKMMIGISYKKAYSI